MSDASKNTELTAALAAIPPALAGLGERVAKIEQSSEAAIKSAIDAARDKVNKDVAEDIRKSVHADLEAKLKAFEAELVERYKALARPGVSLREGVEELVDASETCRDQTKLLFRSISGMREKRTERYKRKFGDVAPFDVLMRGCFVKDGSSFKPYVIGNDDEMVREFQDLCDALVNWQMFKTYQNNGIKPSLERCKLWPEFVEMRGQVLKALDTSSGADWVPTSFSSQLILRYDLDRVLTKMLQVAIVPRFPFDWPVRGNMGEAYLLAENTAAPGSGSETNVGTSVTTPDKVTFNRRTIGGRRFWSYDFDDDSIIAVAGEVRDDMGAVLAFWEERAVLDGDTAGTHQDSDVQAGDARKAWDGLRKIAIANSYSASIATMVAEDFKGMIKSMQQYGAKYTDLLWAMPPAIRAELLTLKDENDNPVMIGIPVIAPQPIVQTLGDVPMLFGIKIAVCQAFRTDLNTSGVHDGTTETKTGVLLLNVPSFRYAMTTEAPVVESQKWIRSRQFEVVASIARDFKPVYAQASNHIVQYGYNATS